MSQLTVKVQGADELVRALGGDVKKAIQRGAHLIAAEVKREVAEYPALSDANVPRSFNALYSIKSRKALNRWYQRGYGTKWARKDGTVGGARTSEMLNRSWGVRRLPLGAFVGSKASYAPVVHHWKEQASFHKRRGWVTDRDAVERVRKSGKMDRIMQQVVDRILKG